jgi:hypothetical protein
VRLGPVTPDYFNAIRIPGVQGRAFTEQDSDDAPAVIIVSPLDRPPSLAWPESNREATHPQL